MLKIPKVKLSVMSVSIAALKGKILGRQGASVRLLKYIAAMLIL